MEALGRAPRPGPLCKGTVLQDEADLRDFFSKDGILTLANAGLSSSAIYFEKN